MTARSRGLPVRVAFTSDLHLDLGERNAALLAHLAARAAALAPDVFVVAGDVAETAAGVERGLRAFAAVGGTKLYLPGNHDLFVEDEAALARGETSRCKFERLLPAAAAAAGFGYLGIEPAWCGDLAIVGTPGWYDYTLRDPALDAVVHREHYRAGRWRDERAFDRGHVLWPRTGAAAPPGAEPASTGGDWAQDEEICAHMLALLERQLASVGAARALLAVVHVLPCLENVQRGAFAASAFHDAYLGSVRFGARLRREPRLRAIVTGHLHRVAGVRVGDVDVLARPVGRVRVARADLASLAAERIGILILDGDQPPA